MKKTLLFIILTFLSINLYAYTDSDMDGVDDSVDRCPNTLLTDLVDLSGCTTKSLVSSHSYDIIIGLNYSDSDYRNLNATDTLASSFQVDYYYKQFSFQASTSYFTAESSEYSDNGFYDSFLGASYRLDTVDNLFISLNAGIILPTYDNELNNNNIDYTTSINISYALKNVNLFGGYAYTLVNDDDVTVVVDSVDYTYLYQNTNSYNAGIGYYLSDKLYMSVSYSTGDSIYNEEEEVESVSFYSYYSIDKDRFATLSYARGLSDTASDNYVSLRFGFLF